MSAYFGYVRLALVGSFAGQAINNILYYSQDPSGNPVQFSAPEIEAFVGDWAEENANVWLGEMVTGYTLASVVATVVDEHNVTVSDSPYSLAINEAGGVDAPTSGPSQVAILGMFTAHIDDVITSLAMKRSYLAIGPVPEEWVGESGALNGTATTAYGVLAALVGSSVLSGLSEYSPVRIGRTPPAGTPRVGTITSVFVRPFASDRRSRRFRPTGI